MTQPVSGHVYRFEGRRRPTWRAKYRLPDGRQGKKTIGPAWTERGRPRAGYYTKRTAEAWLRDVLDQVRTGTLPGMVRTGVTFADACGEYLRDAEHDLDRKPSTLCDYRSTVRAHLLPAFGALRLEDVTADRIEAWKATLRLSNRTKVKLLTVLNGVFVRARRALQARSQPNGRRGEAAPAQILGDRGVLARGDPCARPSRRVRAGRLSYCQHTLNAR